jgi:hypothetical protein
MALSPHHQERHPAATAEPERALQDQCDDRDHEQGRDHMGIAVAVIGRTSPSASSMKR